MLTKRWEKTPSSALCFAIQGVEHWSVTDQLLAEIIDALNSGNWQRAGRKSAPKPKRFPRPWERAKVRKFGSEPIPMSKFDAWWDGMSKRKKRK